MLNVRAGALCLAMMSLPLAAQDAVPSAGVAAGEGSGSPDAARPFRVGAGDHLRIDFYFQPELSRVYPVRPDGEIALHLLGALDVEGLTISEIEALLRERTQDVFQSTQASVIVEMERFRDIYVQGAVSDPGAFPYRPGLTVIQAVALAGGTGAGAPRGGQDVSPSDLSRILDKQRDLALIQARIAQDERRVERLDAQLGEGEAGDPLAELGSRIVETRIRGHELRRDLAEAESDLHRRNREILDGRLARAEAEAQRVGDLDERGLVRAERVDEVEERADRFRSDLLDVSAEAARAARTQSEAENAAELARLEHREALLNERERVSDDLQAARVELRAAQDALRQLGGMPAPALGGDVEELWTITRHDRSGLRTMSVTSDAQLMPGDVLSVTMASAPSQ